MEKLNASDKNLEHIAIAAGEDLPVIKEEIDNHISQFWRIGQAHVVTRIETYNDIKELVVVCMQGADAEYASQVLLDVAKRSGMDSIRFHTQHKGLGRLLKAFSPVEVERVYKVKVNGE